MLKIKIEKECIKCEKYKTAKCPNISKCYSTLDRPFFRPTTIKFFFNEIPLEYVDVIDVSTYFKTKYKKARCDNDK